MAKKLFHNNFLAEAIKNAPPAMPESRMQWSVYFTKEDGEDCFQCAYIGVHAEENAKARAAQDQATFERFKFRVVREPRGANGAFHKHNS